MQEAGASKTESSSSMSHNSLENLTEEQLLERAISMSLEKN